MVSGKVWKDLVQTRGQERDYEKLVANRMFTKFEGVDRVAQDPDIKKKDGTQPKKYW